MVGTRLCCVLHTALGSCEPHSWASLVYCPSVKMETLVPSLAQLGCRNLAEDERRTDGHMYRKAGIRWAMLALTQLR